MSEVIGKFCSVAKKGTIINPKQIPGYITPEGKVLEKDGQQFEFIYTPIEYNISYDLDGGKLDIPAQETYNIEDPDYIPPSPVKKDYTFIGWEPEMIPHGSIGEVNFKAKWKANAILKSGENLRKDLISIAGSAENIMSIVQAKELVSGDYINISCTGTPILAKFSSGEISIFSESQIYCNENMSNAFRGFTILRDISVLATWICRYGTDISGIFKDCSLLSDVSAVENWADGNFSKFDSAFSGTAAFESGRLPAWYKWTLKLNYISSTGLTLLKAYEDHIPGEVLYPKAFGGYKNITISLLPDNPELEYTFEYDPISYDISYETRGGEIPSEAKKTYTIEDGTYYPPEAVKPDFRFAGWSPVCIDHGEYGNVTFIANYIK